MSNSDAREALTDMVLSLRSIFKKYDRGARKKAWKSLQIGQGKHEINQLLDSPSKPLVGIQKWLTFREWIETQDEI
jgi:hypothetical protein